MSESAAGPSSLEPGTVLGIAGSPRRHGNNEQLLDACLTGAASAGAPVFKLPVVAYGISPCRGCNLCARDGECVQRDRMSTEVYGLLDSAAAIVVATPVFFATVPATLKALYDRCQPYWARRHVLGLPARDKRPGALLIARGGGDPFGYGCAETTTRSVFGVLRVSMGDPLVVEGIDEAGDIQECPWALESAAGIGAGLAEATRIR